MRKHFAILVSVFFFWGFVAASNDILIPVFQSKLGLHPTFYSGGQPGFVPPAAGRSFGGRAGL